jgi:transposase
MPTTLRRRVYRGDGCGDNGILYMAMELSNKEWKLAFSVGGTIRKKTIAARNQAALPREIGKAKEKFDLPADAKVRSCYEAGRDGFWIHRFLERGGVENIVVDPGSVEAPKGRKRRKTDRLDAEQLLRRLLRYWNGDEMVWGIARVPTEAQEDERRLHRERGRLKNERTAHRNRIRSLLILQGITEMPKGNDEAFLERVKTWEGKPLPEELRAELRRECRRLEQVEEQFKEVEKIRDTRMKKPVTAADKKAKKLERLKGVGKTSSWILGKEFFGWRDFQSRKEVGQLAGLTGTPYCSGQMRRDQGISKAGNKRIRYVMIELAWGWLRFQPQSELSKWFMRRFGSGGSRMRRVGIVAVARKLLIALWKFVEKDEVPAGAMLKA